MSNYNLYLGDCLEIMPTMEDSSIDAVITDPPYPKEYLCLYEQLAIASARILKEGGLLAAMCGQSYLPEILCMMTPHLDYRWTMAYTMLGGQAVQVWPRRVIAFWKPILIFSKKTHGKKWFGDVVKSPANDKKFHRWGQSEGGMLDTIERLTMPGNLVCDPFMGGGTTGLACIKSGRKFIGIEKDTDCFDVAKQRIEQAQPALFEVA